MNGVRGKKGLHLDVPIRLCAEFRRWAETVPTKIFALCLSQAASRGKLWFGRPVVVLSVSFVHKEIALESIDDCIRQLSPMATRNLTAVRNDHRIFLRRLSFF